MKRTPESSAPDGRNGQNRYLVETVLRACDVLEAFRSESELLRLSEVASRTNLSRPTTLRLLYTLERRGLVERVGAYEYRLGIRPLKARRYRIGYGSHSAQFAFSQDVAAGMQQAARSERVELLVLDNRYSPKTAIRNAEIFVRERMDLVVEFQADEHTAAPIISSKFMEANIPLIAIEVPHPGATYFGANNYVAGVMGGRHLGRFAKQHWRSAVDEVVLLELRMSGPLPAARLTGTLMGIREILPHVTDAQVVRLNGNGQFGPSMDVVRKHLRVTRARRVLVGAINDPSAIGALRAFEESGRGQTCAVVGQNASAEARCELRRPGSQLIGSVAYFPECYGETVIPLGIEILQRKPVPPAVFTKHTLITAENVNHYYPNDSMMAANDLDAILLRRG